MTTTIVTGATGFLGTALVRRLLASGQRVIAMGRNTNKLTALENIGAERHQIDLSHELEARTFPEADYMVHAAALSSPWGRRSAFRAANIDGTATALRIARIAEVKRFVYISSPSIYFRFADQDHVSEDMPLPSPVNRYAASKIEAEALVRSASHLDYVILRPRGIYGPGDTSLLPRLLTAANNGPLPFLRGGIAATDLTFVEDVVDAIIAALQVNAPVERIYNVSGGEALRIRDVVEAAAARAGINVRWRELPWPVVHSYTRIAALLNSVRPARPEPKVTPYSAGLFAFRQTLSLARAKSELNWQPKISFEEGLRETFVERDA